MPLLGAPFAQCLAAVGAADMRDAALALVRRARVRDPADAVHAVVGAPGDRKPLILEGDWLYAERMRVLEERFCARVRERLARRR